MSTGSAEEKNWILKQFHVYYIYPFEKPNISHDLRLLNEILISFKELKNEFQFFHICNKSFYYQNRFGSPKPTQLEIEQPKLIHHLLNTQTILIQKVEDALNFITSYLEDKNICQLTIKNDKEVLGTLVITGTEEMKFTHRKMNKDFTYTQKPLFSLPT